MQQILSELSPIIAIFQSENTDSAIVGNFNINLLQISERQKFGEFFDLMCTNNFFSKISFPTRFASYSYGLIDHWYSAKLLIEKKKHVTISSSIILITSQITYRVLLIYAFPRTRNSSKSSYEPKWPMTQR